MRKYNVMIVDSQPVYRWGIIHILRSQQIMGELHEPATVDQALKLMETVEVDILFLSYRSGAACFDSVKTISVRDRNCKVVIISDYDSLAIALNFFKSGAKGFLHRTMDAQHVVNAIRTVSMNDLYYFSRFEDEISWWLKPGLDAKIPVVKLSDRELQIVNEIALGKTSKDIAMLLHLDIRTIETYRYDLLQKFGVKNTAEMMRYLFQNAILS